MIGYNPQRRGRRQGPITTLPGVILGPELISNGDFASGTGWTLYTNGAATAPTISGGTLNFDSSADGISRGTFATSNITLTAATLYRISFTYSGVANSNYRVTGPDGNLIVVPIGSGTYSADIVSAGTSLSPGITDAGNGAAAVFDNYSIKKVG